MQYKELTESSLGNYRYHDENGNYRLVPLLVSGIRKGNTGQPWKGIDPNIRGKSGMHWVTTHDKLEKYLLEDRIVFSNSGIPNLKYYITDSPGVPLNDNWYDVSLIPSSSSESLGYPTQKPLALLERIINASSNPDDVVLDPFCGCGTAVEAAQKLDRQWIGIDITNLAISLIEKRLRDSFPGIHFEVIGTPKDLEGARDLALRDKYQFQWWACSLVNAQPYQGKKKGADSGIDGLIFFQDDLEGAKKIIVSVKGGESVSVSQIRDIKGTLDREKAAIGLFVTLAEPTRPMLTEAVSTGYYESPLGKSYPKVQILTIEGLLSGHQKAEYPDLARGGLTFKKSKPAGKAPGQMELGV